MYAAAGGASLASRQARQKQRQKQLQQLKNQKELKPPQPKQYHNYTDDAPRLSRVERGALRPPPPHERRHSASNYHLKEPPRNRIKESPSISIPVQKHPSCTLVDNHVVSTPSLQLPQILIPEEGGGLERRCSFVRQVEEMENCQGGGLLDRCNHLCNFEIKEKTWERFTDVDKEAFGSLDYPFSECSQGRAAWQERERGRRCSLSEEARQHRIKQTEAHHRWIKRNRIHDATFGTGSDEDFFSVYHQSAAANALLYVGLGTSAIGSIIFFVGTGEKGFKTLELRMIGPTLFACGLLCCLIRVLLCACPSTCLQRRKKSRMNSNACAHASSRFPKSHDHLDSAALLSKHKKKVSIVPPSQPLPSTSTHETPSKIALPQINLPEAEPRPCREDPVIEMQNFELVYDIQSVSSNDSDDNGVTVIEQSSKLTRTREPAKRNADDVETCLSVVIERDHSESDEKKIIETGEKQTHSGIVLSPLQLGQ